MRQLVLVVDSGCFVASIYALDVRMAKPLLNGRFFYHRERSKSSGPPALVRGLRDDLAALGQQGEPALYKI